jgi:hypothetical protein
MKHADRSPPVTVCIPAYNEEATIAHTLDSVRRQTYPRIVSILVCPNGCSDATAEVCRRMQQRDPRIVVHERDAAGKPDAWNELFERAPTDLIMFMDGDVVAAPDAVAGLVATLEKTEDCIAAAAQTVPSGNARRSRVPFVIPPRDLPVTLVGRLYGVHATALRQRLAAFGITAMPSDIIHEDAWLALLIGSQHIVQCRSAEVYYTYPKLSELLTTQKRGLRARRQLHARYPGLSGAEETRVSTKLRILISQLRTYCGVIGAAELLTHVALRRLLSLLAQVETAGEPLHTFSDGWSVASSSKVPPRAGDRLAVRGGAFLSDPRFPLNPPVS